MLAQVTRSGDTPVVFLAWAPHPMNEAIEITYLSGGDAQFGPDFGGATVHTLARKEWVAACPNAAKLFSQLVFDVPMENVLMGKILDDGMDAKDAAREWLAENPQAADAWLEGVTTLDGQPGGDAVKAAVAG
jgi:glycine betaine/proline transport system substrate-binding protein